MFPFVVGATPSSQARQGPGCRPNVMAQRLHGILFWLLTSELARAMTWTGPSSTTRSRHTHVARAALATEAPPLSTRGKHIDTPSTFESPHICGFVDFHSCMKSFLGASFNLDAELMLDNSYTCAESNTCLWNSHLKIVGCGNPTSIDYITSCIPYRSLQECDSDCLANPSIIQW
jgi:hypothetical protein